MTDVSLAPIVDAVTPIIVQAAVIIIAGAITWAAARFSKATHINIQQSALDKLTAAAQAEAGALIAAAHDNLSGAKIEVGSPMIAAAATRIINAAPGVLEAAGVTPDHVATLVAGALGKMQATMPAPAPTLPAPSVTLVTKG